MITFYIHGRADKRLLVYPLIHTCSVLGRTVVLTDDESFFNVYPDTGRKTEIDYVSLYVGADFKTVSVAEDGIAYRIYVSADADQDLVDKSDTVIECINNTAIFKAERPFWEEEVLKDKSKRVLFAPHYIKGAFDKDDAKKIGVPVLFRLEHILYIYDCEMQKKFLPFTDKSISTVYAGMFASEFDIEAKYLRRIFMRGDYISQDSKKRG